jgi:hypothetical protein
MREQLSGWRTLVGVAFPAFGVIAIALSVLVIYGLIVPDERNA